MKIRHLIIENFRAIERLDFDCSGNVNAFIGDNGAGKSTVLEAIALLYSWLNAKFSSSKGRGRIIRKDDVHIGSEYCFLSIEAEHKGKIARWSLFRGEAPADHREKQTDLKQLESFVIHIREYNEDERYMFSIFGVNRNIASVTLDRKAYGKKEEKPAAIRYSFANTSWKPFFNWYYERENEENRMKARFNIQYHDESLDTIRECLKEVFPHYKNLRIEDRPTRFVMTKDGKDINFEGLSDGEKCYITLVLDIARRLSLLNDGTASILDGEQIVLIDEVDLHLHPAWQLLVISNLEQKFPNCQFFVTSHSPLVLSSLGVQDKLVVLHDGGPLELSDIPYGDNSDYILKRFFGLNEVRNPKVQREIDAIAAELGKQKPNLELVELALDKLGKEGVNFDEAAKMYLVLAQKKKMQ
jgi:predicted ATP-binding protein involved in virulence